jgi:hypothetical protein
MLCLLGNSSVVSPVCSLGAGVSDLTSDAVATLPKSDQFVCDAAASGQQTPIAVLLFDTLQLLAGILILAVAAFWLACFFVHPQVFLYRLTPCHQGHVGGLFTVNRDVSLQKSRYDPLGFCFKDGRRTERHIKDRLWLLAAPETQGRVARDWGCWTLRWVSFFCLLLDAYGSKGELPKGDSGVFGRIVDRNCKEEVLVSVIVRLGHQVPSALGNGGVLSDHNSHITVGTRCSQQWLPATHPSCRLSNWLGYTVKLQAGWLVDSLGVGKEGNPVLNIVNKWKKLPKWALMWGHACLWSRLGEENEIRWTIPRSNIH